ncbi:MAG: glycosyl hydrolase [Muribaculaceae bacterium]|jgi:hypothetical protein|nr:glycosyl hydrolase [Muribaculaceae bacterium]
MKIVYAILILVFSGIVNFSVDAAGKSFKRGVGEDNFNYLDDVKAISAGCSWTYNWGTTPSPMVADSMSKYMEFVPMAWNGNYNETALRTYYTAHPKAKYLLGFNEPNFAKQSNMTPAAAAEKWHALEALAAELGLKLVAPALNYSGDTLSDGISYSTPDKWLDAFIAAYKNLYGTAPTYDYLALHSYMDSPSAVLEFVETFAKKYGKQVWLTEFCSWESSSITAETQQSSMIEKVQSLELSNYVFRYAWFKARGSNKYPYYRLVVYPSASQGIPAGTLTDLGVAYLNMSSYDFSKFYALNELIPATEFVHEDYINAIEKTTDPDSVFPAQISMFGIGRKMTYQIDVPSTGIYKMNFRVTSEENLFNPNVQVLDSAGNVLAEQELTATGSTSTWATQTIEVPLNAGKQKIIVKETKNTHCKLAWLSFSNSAGVYSPKQEQQVRVCCDGSLMRVISAENINGITLFDMSGRMVGTADGHSIDVSALAKGMYVVYVNLGNNKHITIKCIIK